LIRNPVRNGGKRPMESRVGSMPKGMFGFRLDKPPGLLTEAPIGMFNYPAVGTRT